MMKLIRNFCVCALSVSICSNLSAQKNQIVKVEKETSGNKINVFIGKKLFTSFFYPDTLEKPVLYPLRMRGERLLRGDFPSTMAGEPTDHPHHVGMWFNFENVNGLDFWNNSFAIPAEKKHLYGWIKTDRILEMKSGDKGVLSYHANWVNQKNKVLLEETTSFEFSGTNITGSLTDHSFKSQYRYYLRMLKMVCWALGWRMNYKFHLKRIKNLQMIREMLRS